jgi:putative ABC transport system permease protein
MFELRDVRMAIRRLRLAPGFTLVALLTLALGIAATSAIFTVVEAVILRPLPYPHADRLVRVSSNLRRINLQDAGLSASELSDYRDRSGLFDDVVGIWTITANLTGGTEPQRVETVLAGPTYFQLLGARPQLGRLFGPQDYTPGISPVAVISDGLWRRNFGGDPAVIGKTLRIDNDPYTIVGVTEPAFRHPSVTLETETEVWAPSGWIASPFPAPTHSGRFLPAAIGLLKPGISLDEARGRLDAFGAGLRELYPADYPQRMGWAPSVDALKQDLIASARSSLLIVMAAVVLVLLIGCANIANLQLARAAARERDVAVRRALGASPGRIVREQLVESLMLALAGGGLGWLLTLWLLDLVLQLAPTTLPRRTEVGLNWTVVFFSAGASLVTGLLFGLAPAIHSARSAIQTALVGGGRSSGSRERTRARRVLIVAEFAIAVVLLVGGALLVRSFWELQQLNPGFDSRGVTVARIWLPQPNDPSTGAYFTQSSRALFCRNLLNRLRADVGQVGIATGLPLSTTGLSSFTVEGWPQDSTEVGTARTWFVGGDYFATLGVTLVRGRLLDERDDETHPRAIVINQAMARTYWPGEDPLGKRIQQIRRGNAPANAGPPPWITVVGVIGDMRTDGLDAPAPPQMYGSIWQVSSLSLAVTMKPPAGVNPGELLRRDVRAIDADLPVYAIRGFDEVIAARNATRRFVMVLVGLFGVAALLLAALGIYGVIAYAVSQRQRELGIRIALGARPAEVVRLVLKDGLRLTLAGVALGVAGALATSRLLAGLLVGVGANDPLTFAAIVLLLVLVALAACWVPARRAAAVDPLTALRAD